MSKHEREYEPEDDPGHAVFQIEKYLGVLSRHITDVDPLALEIIASQVRTILDRAWHGPAGQHPVHGVIQ